MPKKLLLALLAFTALTSALLFGPAGFGPPPESAEGTYPGVNGKIAFVRDVGGNFEIFSMNADGSDQMNLTNDPSGDFSPDWSPDGTKIAFSSDRDGNQEIYVMDADGSNQTRITNDPDSNSEPVWSPDGSMLAFTGFYPDGISLMNADGSGRVSLTAPSAINVSHTNPDWAPDGSRIVFSDLSTPVGGNIVSIEPDGSGYTLLTTNWSLPDEYPSWSPDGTKIAYFSWEDWSLAVMNADGSGKISLSMTGYNYGPSWSPDGEMIAFSDGADIHLVGPDGSGLVNLTNDGAGYGRPDWQSLDPSQVPTPPPPSFRLPWAGADWYYTGGPHGPQPSSVRSGIDFAPFAGSTAVRAVAGGTVTFAGWGPSFYCDVQGIGRWVRNREVHVDHGGGWQTRYVHLESTAWGDIQTPSDPKPTVTQGDYLGEVGQVGCATGIHTHLDLRQGGAAQSWDQQSIDGWDVYSGCVGYSGPGTCQTTWYNGYIENLATNTQVLPSSQPTSSQLITSNNSGGAPPPDPVASESFSLTIGPSGGSLGTGTGDSAELILTLPAGALGVDTEITIDVFDVIDWFIFPPGAGDYISRVFSFLPSGTQFGTTGEVSLSYTEAEVSGIDENNLGAIIYNVLTGEAELADIVNLDTVSNILTFELPHFSLVTIRDLSTSDLDDDGCTDSVELGADESLGGLRDPLNPWDFYDVPGTGGAPPDGQIDLFIDILGVIQHYSLDGSPPYDAAFDRGPTAGPNPWNMTAPDGSIDLFTDILGVIQQHGHDCT